MAEALKNIYDLALLESISKQLASADSDFPVNQFMELLLAEAWDARELKDRMRHVSTCLGACMTGDYASNLDTLRIISPHFSGLAHLFIPDFVEQFGLDYYAESVQAMEDFTGQCSSEFAVRPFIKQYPEAMMQQMMVWAESEDEHVRRLASEGSRTKLPWAMAVPYLKENPERVIALLKSLRDDPSEYVRRSVANNLNDISKGFPQLVIDLATAWLGKNKDTDRLVKHACRTLLKQGNTQVMRLFGYRNPQNILLKNFNVTESLAIGDSLQFSFQLEAAGEDLGKLRLEYAIEFLLGNGRHSKKVFKISEGNYQENSRCVEKTHSFRVITTRRYYPGPHHLGIIVNGVELDTGDFQLIEA